MHPLELTRGLSTDDAVDSLNACILIAFEIFCVSHRSTHAGFETAFRNKMSDVQSFLQKYHPNHYKVRPPRTPLPSASLLLPDHASQCLSVLCSLSLPSSSSHLPPGPRLLGL